MADVTITGLPRGTPLGRCFVPVSDGVVTVKSPISALQVDFSNITGQPNSIPTGGIILWSGAANAIPSGWALCNGANGTPNLVDKFVLGAGTSTPAVGATGGSKDAIVVSHTHTATDSGHTHTYTFAGAKSQAAIGSGATTFSSTQTTGSGTANITVAATGVTGTNANMPPYYALCYIMKT
jgi:microcystin-dependent protein